MPTATIVFVDVVGYSRKSAVLQNRLIRTFNSALRPHIKHLFGLKPDQLLCLPTGDGAALTFLHINGKRKWSIEAIVDLIFDLQGWARLASTPNSKLALRIGVHVGPVEIVKDINNRANVCGSAINLAQRVMDAAHPRQVLLSGDAVKEYVGTENNVWKLSARLHTLYRIDGPFEIQIKHGEGLNVYRLLPEGAREHGWNGEDPEVKFWLSVSATPTPKQVLGSFSDRLSRAKNIALVQLTGERLLDALRKGRASFSKELQRLWVFLPNKRYCVTPTGKPDNCVRTKLARCTAEWQRYGGALSKRLPNAKVEIKQYEAPPFFGASYLDWEEPGGFIHVSPYIWGIDASQCPGFDITWAGRKPLPLYRTYVSGLMDLYQTSKGLRTKGKQTK